LLARSTDSRTAYGPLAAELRDDLAGEALELLERLLVGPQSENVGESPIS
jgi:hypothetical protein